MGKAGLEFQWPDSRAQCSCLGRSRDGVGREKSWMWWSLVVRFELASKGEEKKSPMYVQEVQFE